MAIELIDPEATLEFTPESEKGQDKPTVIHLRLPDMRDSFARNRLFKINREAGGSEIEFASDDVWLDYIIGRVVKIENVKISGKITTITSPEQIEDALKRMPQQVGSDLFAFIISNSGLTEEQAGN